MSAHAVFGLKNVNIQYPGRRKRYMVFISIVDFFLSEYVNIQEGDILNNEVIYISDSPWSELELIKKSVDK